MPELPEVETVVRRIRPLVVGRRIESAKVLWERTAGGMTGRRLGGILEKRKIIEVSRRAKYILIHLAPSGYLVVHLRMSGDLIVAEKKEPEEKHLRVSLQLDSGSQLRFVDTRKFGRFVYHDEIDSLLQRLGPEPIDSDFDCVAFYRQLKKTRRTIKPVLLDQRMLSGLGNIYVVESLWRAGVHPLKRADSLSQLKTEQLMRAAADILQEAINAHGTDLGDGVWKTGGFTPSAYGREGEPCLRCGSMIRKIRVAQRGTEFCARCQRR